jgi:hypothetical protein
MLIGLGLIGLGRHKFARQMTIAIFSTGISS